MLHYNELIMSVYDALRGASIRVQNFAQAQPGRPAPPWEAQRPSFTVYMRVRYGMLWGMAILAVRISSPHPHTHTTSSRARPTRVALPLTPNP